jgi:hypothetical protein
MGNYIPASGLEKYIVKLAIHHNVTYDQTVLSELHAHSG